MIKDIERNEEKEGFDDNLIKNEQDISSFPSGVSIESASYMENNNLIESEINPPSVENNNEEYTPKLFSEEPSYQSEDSNMTNDDKQNNDADQLFHEDINEEEDFEIPAFLRKQKF